MEAGMAQQPSYRDQAETARLAAERATLANVRDNHLRAAAAWTELADRKDLTDKLRAERERITHES
jgi:hypothetical protein